MPASTASLESLSSPSPSPPPPEEHHSNHSNSGAAGLDSGSELSELTEDEQDSNNRANDDDASRSSARSRSRRDRIVPAPMWDWAYKQRKSEKKDKTDWRNKPAEEEEEEEEQAGPAKAMEEEEDDDQDKESNPDGDDSHRKGRPLSDNEVDDNEDDLHEDDGESVDEVVSSNHHKEVSGDVSPEDEDEDELEDAPDPDVDRTPKVAASPDLTDDENDNVGEDEVDEDELPELPEPTKDTFEADDEDEDDPEPVADDVEIPDADEPPTTEAVTPAEIVDDPVEEELDTAMDVDAPAPVLMSPVLVAASSIMAGASLIQPETPASSQPSTPSISRVSSRYPSAEPEQGPDVASEPEAEPEPERKPSSGRAPRSRKGKARTRAARRSRAAAADVGEADGDGDQAEGIEGEAADADDIDAATPELDMDAEMQPAHRAEALDVLASIELKFALLRERLYVEKMDTLAWEEGLVADGTHPELLHLHAELSKRRDKRLELASRRRDYEVANVTKRRRLDEEGVWSWWKDARDELQTDMISETNSKRRRLERERRALERPQPTRRLPLPPVEVPPAPTLREIVKSSPFGIPEAALPLSKRYQRKREPPPPSSLVYPQINSLSPGEIAQDINLFEQHRRAAAAATFDPHRGMPGLMNSVLGGMPPPGMDPYAMGMPVMDGPPGGRFAPPFDQHLQQQGLVQGFAAPPRLSHHHSAPPGAMPHLSHSQMLEREMAMGMRPPSGMPQHPSHLPQQFGPGPGPSTLMRRSISPVPLSNGAGPSSGIPASMGGGPPPPGFSGPKPNGWTGPPTGVHMSGGKETGRMNGEERERDRDRMGETLSQRERVERERARDIEREREAERAYHMSHGQQRHPLPQHVHQHGHPNPQGPSIHGSHHHHHHHVRHHHHPPHQTFSGPGGTPHAPPMAGLPPSSTNGPAPPGQSLSPHSGREFEPRRPRSGAPTEVIELSASSQKQAGAASPRMSAFWKGDEALPPESQRERERDRGRAPGPGGPPPPGPHERMVTPFTMGPSQPLQGSRPGSPRGAPGLSTHPPSMPTSRRGSWSGPPEDSHLVRPPSASHGPGLQAGSSNSQRPSISRIAQPPSFHSPFGSPPYGNGRAPQPPTSPPPSTAFAGSIRSPARGGPLGRAPIGGPPGMPLSPPPQMTHSPRPAGSPGSSKLASRGRPPSPRLGKGLPKMEGFPMPESGNIAPIGTGVPSSAGPGGLPGPGTLLPPLPSASVSRMSNGGLGEKPPAHLAGGPAASKVVPVDGP
ncbi:hypothetical protein C8Q78DRAFT_971960 [Trametes maxima]|nr:hypothetical protein C8Q78DRAFT_971960 [Trametes maxima]